MKNGPDNARDVISGPRYETRIAIDSYCPENLDDLDEVECKKKCKYQHKSETPQEKKMMKFVH